MDQSSRGIILDKVRSTRIDNDDDDDYNYALLFAMLVLQLNTPVQIHRGLPEGIPSMFGFELYPFISFGIWTRGSPFTKYAVLVSTWLHS